jgi:hypothetical protein
MKKGEKVFPRCGKDSFCSSRGTDANQRNEVSLGIHRERERASARVGSHPLEFPFFRVSSSSSSNSNSSSSSSSCSSSSSSPRLIDPFSSRAGFASPARRHPSSPATPFPSRPESRSPSASRDPAAIH